MVKILIVEDDQEISRLLCDYMQSLGYGVVSAKNGLSALTVLRDRQDIGLVLLDLMLPFQSGDMVLTKLREFSETPVIVLSAKDTVRTKIDMIRLGADDYITKPFDLDEVAVRIEAVLRRSEKKETGSTEKLQYKDLQMDCNAGKATIKGNELILTSKEYGILELLLRNPTKLFSKANLFESVWNEPYFNEDSTLKVHMSNLRNKIKQYEQEEYIETVWRMGYRLKQ